MDLKIIRNDSLIGEFNKEYFKVLIIRALSDMTITEFAIKSGVDRSYLSKYINCQYNNPPSPMTLSRIAYHSDNKVSYLELMNASGYITLVDEIPNSKPDEKSIGEYLRQLRKRQGISGRQLEALSGVSNSHINLIENGNRFPSSKTLKRLSPHLNISFLELQKAAGYIE